MSSNSSADDFSWYKTISFKISVSRDESPVVSNTKFEKVVVKVIEWIRASVEGWYVFNWKYYSPWTHENFSKKGKSGLRACDFEFVLFLINCAPLLDFLQNRQKKGL